MEKKDVKDGMGGMVSRKYFPGLVVDIPLPRSALQPTVQFFLPAVLTSFFVLAASDAEFKEETIIICALALLGLIILYMNLR